jgi:N-methylhydantoinase A/oxoprolinase/acetone carboxylase beta subunit
VVCFEPTATAYTTLTTAVSVDVGGTATAYAVYQSEGERHKFEGGQAPTPA